MVNVLDRKTKDEIKTKTYLFILDMNRTAETIMLKPKEYGLTLQSVTTDKAITLAWNIINDRLLENIKLEQRKQQEQAMIELEEEELDLHLPDGGIFE